MKKFIALTAVVSLFFSCGSNDRGELVGVKGKKWSREFLVFRKTTNSRSKLEQIKNDLESRDIESMYSSDPDANTLKDKSGVMPG